MITKKQLKALKYKSLTDYYGNILSLIKRNASIEAVRELYKLNVKQLFAFIEFIESKDSEPYFVDAKNSALTIIENKL